MTEPERVACSGHPYFDIPDPKYIQIERVSDIYCYICLVCQVNIGKKPDGSKCETD